MKKNTIVVWIGILLILFSHCLAGNGETGAQFLKIGISPRASGMGEALLAVSGSPYALAINPAGLAGVRGKQFVLSHRFWLQEMSHDYLGAAVSRPWGTVGIGLIYSSSGDIPGYRDFLYAGDYSATDLALQMGYGRKLGKNLRVGITGMVISQKIEEESASGMAVNIGTQYRLPFGRDSRLGLAVQNLGGEMKFIEQGDPLPTRFEFGGSHRIQLGEHSLLLVASLQKVVKEDMNVQLGGEFIFRHLLALRAGYRSRYSYSLGFGLLYRNLQFDYAYVPYNDLTDTHHLGIVLGF